MNNFQSVFAAIASYSPTCEYYRIKNPLRILEKHGIETGRNTPGESKDMLVKAALTADVTQLYLPMSLSFWNQIVTSASMMNPVVGPTDAKFPPTFIFDADDNPDFMHPFNQSFVHSGTKNLDGLPLKPGDKLTTHTPDGSEVLLWEDRVTTQGGSLFDIGFNLEQEQNRKVLIRKCHGATVASVDLANYYRDVLGQKNVHVYYNTIFPEDYQFGVRAVRTDPEDTIRIFWQGGQSHISDWLPLAGAVKEVAARYPNTKWVFMGDDIPVIYEGIPRDRVEILPWIHYEAYRLRRTLLHVDINLCPLADTLFNRCKSAIKWYESTVSENTEATLAQNVGPYKEIVDGATGLLFNSPQEFAQKLGQLIEDAELRKRLGAHAKEWVWNNRLPKHTGPDLYAFYRETRERHVAELSPKIITTVPRSIKELIGGTS